MMISPRPEVLAVTEAVHGAVNNAELIERGIDPRTVLDFSASINPFGPSPQVLEALTKVPIDRYPDREATELRQALAARLDVPTESVIAGNGSSELLYLIALAYLRPDDVVVIIGPTYSEYDRVATLMGARITPCDATGETGFQVPTELIDRTLRSCRPRALFLCNPNNPTAQCLPAEIIRQWADEFPQTLFIIDEAYIEFASVSQSVVGTGESNVVVLRSLTKAYGLAGLRLGYAVASEDIVRVLCRIRPPWSVSAVAQAAGIAAVADDQYFQRCLQHHIEAKAQLEHGVRELGMCALPSAAPFFLVQVGDAAKVRSALFQFGILVRDCSSFGLAALIRLSPRCSADNVALLTAMQSIMK
ncbi:MAG: histidinol-phosphate aminotransferase family protein [Planctomycetaceae bacterium]|nr:histidinol-phosphate aminotransferase family protein [Planctomycetaceae bacterium]